MTSERFVARIILSCVCLTLMSRARKSTITEASGPRRVRSTLEYIGYTLVSCSQSQNFYRFVPQLEALDLTRWCLGKAIGPKNVLWYCVGINGQGKLRSVSANLPKWPLSFCRTQHRISSSSTLLPASAADVFRTMLAATTSPYLSSGTPYAEISFSSG